jgi:hypothetical protein
MWYVVCPLAAALFLLAPIQGFSGQERKKRHRKFAALPKVFLGHAVTAYKQTETAEPQNSGTGKRLMFNLL